VRAVVERSHASRAQERAQRRHEAQARARQIDLSDYKEEVTDKEYKTVLNLCKTGKISAVELKRLSKAVTKKSCCEQFLAEDGCLHSLVGLATGKDCSKQILALYCLANLAAQDVKPAQIARASGAYLITMISGANSQLCELSCSVLVNLTRSGEEETRDILVNMELVPSLINLTTSAQDNVKELAYLALYNLVTRSHLEGDVLATLTRTVTSGLADKRLCSIHLLWLLFSLSSNQMLHDYLANYALLDSLLKIATYEIFQKCDSRPLVKVLTPIVRILANLSGGPLSVEVALHMVRHQDFPAILTALLSTNYTSLCQETVWLLANIVNNENVLVQEEFVEMDLMDKLEHPAATAIHRLDPYSLTG